MTRRGLLRLLFSTLLVVPFREPKPPPFATGDTSAPEPPGTCGICGSSAVSFDYNLDINICLKCGAHETVKGWQAR